MRPFGLLTITVLALSGCDTLGGGAGDGDGGPAIDPANPPVTNGAWMRPAATATWQWQLQPGADGKINTAYNVDVYDIDLFDASADVINQLHASGHLVIAYFSAGTFENFRSDAGEFQAQEIGSTLGDFPNERWLDIRSENVRRVILARLDSARQRGFDGVEPDNVDGYANDSGFDLTAADQLAFNRFVANEAHLRNLAVGLKNDLDQIGQLVSYFDFAVNEQCHEFGECDALQPFLDAGKPVFNAEYQAILSSSESSRAALCDQARGENIRTLILPLDLNDSFRFSCDP